MPIIRFRFRISKSLQLVNCVYPLRYIWACYVQSTVIVNYCTVQYDIFFTIIYPSFSFMYWKYNCIPI